MTVALLGFLCLGVLGVYIIGRGLTNRRGNAFAALPEGAPAYTEKQAEEIIESLIPLVEKHAGRKFTERPVFKIASRDDLIESLSSDLEAQMPALMPSATAVQIEELARQQATFMSPVLLGKYEFLDNTLYLLPRNVKPLMELAGVDGKYEDSLVKLVIAHEMVHVLQNQELLLAPRLSSLKSIEAGQAFNCTIEGHAVLIQDAIGGELGLDDAVRELGSMMSAGAVKLDDSLLEMFNNIIATQFEQIYIGGRKFMEYHFEQGGTERLWDILAAPPVNTAMILNPETYAPELEHEYDYASILYGLESEFGDRDWLIQNMQVGEIMLRTVYATMPKEDMERILSKYQHVQTLVAQQANPLVMANISVCHLTDSKSADDIIDTLDNLAVKNMDAIKSSPMVESVGLDQEDFDFTDVDRARKTVIRVNAVGGGSEITLFYRIVRGNVMVEIMTVGLELTDLKATEIAELVFLRCSEAGIR